MPRRAIGHERAVNALAAARVAGRAAVAWGELGDFQINDAGLARCAHAARADRHL